MVLFINACARKESRTLFLAKNLLHKFKEEKQEIVNLYDLDLPILDEDLINKRNSLVINKEFSAEELKLAKQFSLADTIIIATPFWDLSFPAILKRYLELVSVCSVTFAYTEEGTPMGLCRANSLYYVTTAGGPILNDSFGFGYVKALTGDMFGIKKHYLIKAENLDIIGNDVESILNEAIKEIEFLKKDWC